MPASDTKELALRFVDEVWGNGDLDAGRELLSPDLVDRHPREGQAPGAEGFLETIRLYHAAFPVRRFLPERLIVQGDEVHDTWEMIAYHEGDFFGLPATGKLVTVTGADWCRFHQGRIVEIWHEQDVFGAKMMLNGVLP
jgi:predicted ester cyclase